MIYLFRVNGFVYLPAVGLPLANSMNHNWPKSSDCFAGCSYIFLSHDGVDFGA